jgi:hypothetical protein
VVNPRHIEIQVMADSKGNVVHLGERECSIQRRHQKIIEEAPSLAVPEKLRRRMGRTAVEAAAAVQYVNAGTIEFLLDKDGNYYFMEMNTRIQVEHGVTELVTGRDLVKEQIHVAAGEALSFSQKDVTFSGHALECRINAEDPWTFTPSPGTIRHFFQPGGPGVRVDTFAHEGCEISPYYDSMIAKLMTHGRTRAEAIARMKRSLDVMVVEGIKTNIPLHRKILDDPDFVAGASTPATWNASCPRRRPPRPRERRRGEGDVVPLRAPAAAAARAGGLPLGSWGGASAAQLLLPGLRDGLLPAAHAAVARAGRRAACRLESLRVRRDVPGARALPARPADRALAGSGLRLLAADAAPAARRAGRLLARAPASASRGRRVRRRSGLCALGVHAVVAQSLRVLQALALAPFVAGLLRRAALHGGRSVVWAAAAVALGFRPTRSSSSGRPCCWAWHSASPSGRPREALPRLAGALALGAGLAGVPIALVAGVLGETARGAGFGGDVALANAVAPVVLLQTLVPHLFGFPEAPAEAFWGGRFFSKGLPYFLTLYLGPLTLGLAALGASRIERRARLALLALAGLGLLYALGDAGGLAPLVHRLGLSGAFRFPSKALLLPQLAVALAAGFGFGRVAEERGALGQARRPLRARRRRGPRGARSRGGSARRARGLERRPARCSGRSSRRWWAATWRSWSCWRSP